MLDIVSNAFDYKKPKDITPVSVPEVMKLQTNHYFFIIIRLRMTHFNAAIHRFIKFILKE